jgi:hypothetical protein
VAIPDSITTTVSGSMPSILGFEGYRIRDERGEN